MKINIQTKRLHIYKDRKDGTGIVLYIFGKEIHFTVEERKMEGLSALFGDDWEPPR